MRSAVPLVTLFGRGGKTCTRDADAVLVRSNSFLYDEIRHLFHISVYSATATARSFCETDAND